MPNTVLSCAVGIHPSPHVQLLQKSGPTMEQMLRAVSVPLLYCPSWNDPPSLREGGYWMKLLNEGGGKGSKSVLFNNQIHGWAIRADIRVPQNKRDFDKLMSLMLDFFAEHLEGKVPHTTTARL